MNEEQVINDETYFDYSTVKSTTRRGRPHIRQPKWPCRCGSMRLLRHESMFHGSTEWNKLPEKMKYSLDIALSLVGVLVQPQPGL